MKFYNVLLYLTIGGMGFLSGCDNGDDEPKTKLPSNLQITIDPDEATPGKVSVSATAENANYFVISFGEPGSSAVTSTDGNATYKYGSSGTYKVTVKAHATPNDLIEASHDVTIAIPISDEGYISPSTRDGFELAWQDEFNGETLNTSYWNYETGAGGWGNNELQYYRQENTVVSDGYLVITAKKESFSGSQYTSSRLTTKGKKEFLYGRIDIRAKLPKGQGIWPALWMLGGNISTVGWPACGEIDIMEMIGGQNREKTVHGTVHWSNENNAHAHYGGSKTLSSGIYPDKFYVYSIEWTGNYIKWYIDDVFYHQIDLTPSHLSELKAQHFFIFNIAVGGNWPGNPDTSTVFPQQMLVDYIRVFQK